MNRLKYKSKITSYLQFHIHKQCRHRTAVVRLHWPRQPVYWSFGPYWRGRNLCLDGSYLNNNNAAALFSHQLSLQSIQSCQVEKLLQSCSAPEIGRAILGPPRLDVAWFRNREDSPELCRERDGHKQLMKKRRNKGMREEEQEEDDEGTSWESICCAVLCCIVESASKGFLISHSMPFTWPNACLVMRKQLCSNMQTLGHFASRFVCMFLSASELLLYLHMYLVVYTVAYVYGAHFIWGCVSGMCTLSDLIWAAWSAVFQHKLHIHI